MTKFRLSHLTVVLLVIATGCSKTADRTDTSGAKPDTTAMGGMAGMPGMAGGSDMMASMVGHVSMMNGMSADSMRAMLPSHRQTVANALARMNSDMQQMNMTADAAWTALADSIRKDLTRMPEMTAPQLKAAMPSHGARVTRLGEMHRSMMGSPRK